MIQKYLNRKKSSFTVFCFPPMLNGLFAVQGNFVVAYTQQGEDGALCSRAGWLSSIS